MKVVIDLTRPIDSRVVSVKVLCRKCTTPEYLPLDPTKTYRVIVGGYLASGGDRFEVFPKYGFNHKYQQFSLIQLAN